MYCIQCGAEIPETAKFCPNCGAVINRDTDNSNKPKSSLEELDSTPSVGGQDCKEDSSHGEFPPRPLSDDASSANHSGNIDSANGGLKSKIHLWWKKLSPFGKISTISAIIIAILLAVSICVKRPLPIVVSVLQIGGLVSAIFIHKGVIKTDQKWLKYLVIIVAIALSAANIASYSLGQAGKGSRNPSSHDSQESKVSTPYDAATCVGKDLATVENDFSSVGFTNITSEPLEDLEITEIEKEGLVEVVTINGTDNFEGNEDFSPTSRVLISYHSVKAIPVPISSETALTTDTNDLLDLFTETGFTEISTDEAFDLDPDEMTAEFENEVTIGETTSFEETDSFPMNAPVKIVTHRAYEKFDVKLVIDFVQNLMFSTYDVELDFAGEKKTLSHGTDAEFDYRLKAGTYSLTFSNVESSSVKGSVQLVVEGETEASYQILCYKDEITVKTVYIENKSAVGEDEAMIPMSASTCIYKNYADVENSFKNAGFTNITTRILYDIVWGFTSEGEVDSVTVDGSNTFTRGDIFLKTASVVITYHMPEEDDPSYIQMSKGHSDYVGLNYLDVEQEFKNLGFSDIVSQKKITHDASHKDGEVYSISMNYLSFNAGDKFKPNATVRISYYVYEAEEPPEEEPTAPPEDDPGSTKLSYTTNDLETAKKGNTGVYAYKKGGKVYDIYYIIDFDEGYVYNFMEGDGNTLCDRVKIVSGDLNSVVIITYHDGDTEWSYGLHFKWVNQPDHLILEDNDHFEYDLYATDLYYALNLKSAKKITNY